MTSLKKMTDRELELELARRQSVHDKDNKEYWQIQKLEREAWRLYNISVFAVEDVRVETARRDKKLRKSMKPFHSFTRTQTEAYWPLLSSACGCGWAGEAQSARTAGASVSECWDILTEMEIYHLKDVREASTIQYTINKGE